MKLKSLLTSYKYEFVAMITGATVLILEITGARLIAPYFGSSTYVWTAMIGVILGALSLGFWIGGKAADKDSPKQDIPLILTFAGVLVAVMALIHKEILELIAKGNFDLRLSSLLAALVLFSVPSALIGMVSPHLAKIRLQSLKTSGETIGRLEAAGAVGSIFGTFLSGYFLLSYFGSTEISMFLAFVLLLTSFIVDTRRIRALRILIIGTILLLLFNIQGNSQGLLLDKDTPYARYQVQSIVYNGETTHLLKTDNSAVQSAFYPNNPNQPPLDYAKLVLDIVSDNYVDIDSILVIGGGAHTLPTLLHQRYPNAEIVAIEIDPALDAIAKEYFGYSDTEKIKLIYQDGRTFLNNNSEKFQLIIVDAYSGSSIPFHLTTYEAVQRMSDALSYDGLLIANVISRADLQFLSSVASTYQNFFSVKPIAVRQNINTSKSNYLLLATKDKSESIMYDTTMDVAVFDSQSLYDNFAPVERLSY